MKLYSWGANSYGQLSHGMQSEQCLYPTELVTTNTLENVVAVAGGGGHTLVLDSNGSVLGAGSNSHGQLADSSHNTTVLVRLQGLQEFSVTGVECGWDSSYAITRTGSVVAWGSNKYGQLGVSKEKVVTTKHPVVLDTPTIMQISAGLRHTAMVSSDGHVLTCGQASRGQLGVIGADGNVPKTDCDSLVRVEGVEDVCQVACGQHHTLALTADGRVYGWGDNRRGQLGQGPHHIPTPHLITTCEPGATIKAGWTHSAVLSGGKLTTWGRNSYSQLGHSCDQERVDRPTQLTDLRGVAQLELGSEHNLALLDNGEVWTWGWNEHGNCGTGTVENVAVPQLVNLPSSMSLIAAGAGHSLALKSSS
uniref:RCC1-like domain-containing protein n=1 Tax=Graphocephala atropunctata TaxID=36148 RepID=A0A1B6LKJ4_9HEMI